MKNLIDQFYDVISSITDAPNLFIEAAGYFLISTLCGKNVRSKLSSSPYELSANDWFMITGSPGVTRKSVVIGHTKRIQKEVLRRVLRKNLMRRDPEDDRPIITIINEVVGSTIIENATPQGLLDHLTSTHEFTPFYSIIAPEFGGIIDQVKEAKYMSGYQSLLSSLYTGEGYSQRMASTEKVKDKYVSRKRDIPENLYVTALFGMQEPKKYLDASFIEQGLLRRIILLNYEKRERSLPFLDTRRGGQGDDELQILKELKSQIYEKTIEYYNVGKILVDPIPGSIAGKINNQSNEFEKKYTKSKSLIDLYRYTMGEHLLKLTMINAIASRSPKQSVDYGYLHLQIEEEDYQKAWNFLSAVLEKSETAISAIGTKHRERDYVEVKGTLEFVESIVKSYKDGITVKQLINDTNQYSYNLMKIIETLIKAGRIIPVEKRSSDSTLYLYHSKFEGTLSGEPINPALLESYW